jgi:hypothetical protein
MRQFNAPFFSRVTANVRALVIGVGAVGALAISVGANAQEQTGTNLSAYGNNPPANFLQWTARNFVVVAGDDPNDPRYATMKGTGYDGVAALFIQRSDGNFLCTGALLSGTLNILTAAHCLANTSGQDITQSVTAVFFPPGQPATVREFVTSSSTHVNPLYTGEVIDAHDVAVVSLGSAPSSAILRSGYSLFDGNPFQAAQFVGSGTTGTGATGGDPTTGGFTLGDRRRARNTIDFTWTDPEWGGFWPALLGTQDLTTLVADFDNGLDDNNSSCIFTVGFGWLNPTCGLGQGLNEGTTGPGDSGGPLFIDGKLAGVASYGITFGLGLGDIDDDLNESFGEFAGWTSTQYNEDWIAPYAVPVPEPASFVLVGVGLVAVFGAHKNRRRS